MSDDPSVVRVYVPHPSVVKEVDVMDWLSHLGTIEVMKQQFDAGSGRPCYFVKFKSSEAARQAATFLHGQQLKGTAIEIRSNVFAPPSPSSPGAPASGSTKPPAAAITPSPHLPHNHLVPSASVHSMDEALTRAIPDLLADGDRYGDAAALVEELRQLQESLVSLTEKAARAKQQAASEGAAQSGSGAGPGSTMVEDAPLCYESSRGFKGGMSTVSDCVQRITDLYGPVMTSNANIRISAEALIDVQIRFIHHEDAEVFYRVLTGAEAKKPAAVAEPQWVPIEESRFALSSHAVYSPTLTQFQALLSRTMSGTTS